MMNIFWLLVKLVFSLVAGALLLLGLLVRIFARASQRDRRPGGWVPIAGTHSRTFDQRLSPPPALLPGPSETDGSIPDPSARETEGEAPARRLPGPAARTRRRLPPRRPKDGAPTSAEDSPCRDQVVEQEAGDVFLFGDSEISDLPDEAKPIIRELTRSGAGILLNGMSKFSRFVAEFLGDYPGVTVYCYKGEEHRLAFPVARERLISVPHERDTGVPLLQVMVKTCDRAVGIVVPGSPYSARIITELERADVPLVRISVQPCSPSARQGPEPPATAASDAARDQGNGASPEPGRQANGRRRPTDLAAPCRGSPKPDTSRSPANAPGQRVRMPKPAMLCRARQRRVDGPWEWGVVLDVHTVHSTRMADGEFDNTYSPLGEAVNRLKYGRQRKYARPIAECICYALENEGVECELVTVVPWSEYRPVQPLEVLAQEVSRRLGIPYRREAVARRSGTDARPIKDVEDPGVRERILKDAFRADRRIVGGRRVLLLDDIWRSGATARAAAGALRAACAVPCLVVATYTRTRR